jgi:hypothetical protein
MTQQDFAVYSNSRSESVVAVRDAGLFIAAPFLARLWSMLSLVVEHSFVDCAATERAVRLMDYLVFGTDAPTESTSALGRILCGLPPTEALGATSSLLARERQAIDDLMAAMITQWKAIGSTSIEVLEQHYFCARETIGKRRTWLTPAC